MRSFLLSTLAVASLAAMLTIPVTDANAVVCARGVARAGCVSAGGAAVVRRPVVAACRYVVVNGVRVRRCT
jgi:hypothetical protein